MADTTKIIYKLQTALKQKGVIITINTYQIYSEENNRYIKIYQVKNNTKEIIKSSSQIKIIKALQALLEEYK